MHILKDVIYSLLVNYLLEDSTFEAADSCQSHWHEPSDCEPDLSAEVLRDKTNPVEKKKLSYWLYSTTERIWSTNRSFIIFCPKRTFFQGRGPIWILQKFHSRSIQHHDIFRFTLPWCLWVDCYPWVVSEASCRMLDLLHKKETALYWWTEDGYFLNETFVPKQQKPSKQAKSPSCKDIDQLQSLT